MSSSTTAREASLQGWLDRATSHRLLTAVEERDLARRVAKGDTAARDRLVEHNLKLVVSLAAKHRWTGREFEDLIQDGMIGLIRAAEKFDPDRGCRFSTYAFHWVRSRIQGRPVVSVDEVSVLDAEASDEHGGTLGSLQPDEHAEEPHEAVAQRLTRAALKEAVADLPHLQRRAFEIRNGLDGFGPSPKPLSFVAIVLGISRERVYQLDMMTRSHLRENAPHLR